MIEIQNSCFREIVEVDSLFKIFVTALHSYLKCAAVCRCAQNIPYAISVDSYYDIFSKLLLEAVLFLEVNNGKFELESLVERGCRRALTGVSLFSLDIKK